MIVKHHLQGWEIISHYAHGLLSGKIASQLRKNVSPEHWVDILTGVIEHDDHLLNYDEHDYITEIGTPKDFTMDKGSKGDSLEHAERVFYNAMQKSQLVALLVGRHLEYLYESLAKEFQPMKKFLSEIGELRAGQRKLYGLKKTEEDHLYDILLFSDRLSLILCQNEIPEVGRKIEINQTIGAETYYIRKIDNNHLTVEPWPFEDYNFELHLEYRLLSTASFKDNSELEKEIKEATVKKHSFTLRK